MKRTTLVVTAATLALVGAGAAPTILTADAARAARAPSTRILAKGLVSPLSLSVAKDGTRYFSMNFAGGVFRQRPGRQPTQIFQTTGGAEAGAVSQRRGSVIFGVTVGGGPQGTTKSYLMRIGRNGRATRFAEVGAYERRRNPDQVTTYGFQGLDAGCATLVPKKFGPAPTYTGKLDSHPYATLMTRKKTYLADAAANAILAISRAGKISTVAVLPAVPVVITAAAAAANKIPACAVGKTYLFEPVPTDVERGPDGALYVSSLPGGPEDGSTGANGLVFRVEPRTGAVTVVATGLLSPVGLAVAKNGDLYVSQLFAGLISRVAHGTTTAVPYLKAPLPGDLELVGGALYATVNVLPGKPQDPPAGKLVRVLR